MACAVLFADVAGSTALYERLGDERAFALVARCLQVMSACAGDGGGRVVKTIGDAVMAVFPTADSAARAAAAMHRGVQELGPQAGMALALRSGLHHGPVVAHGDDVYGDTVNLAARLCDLASRGQCVTDAATAQLLTGTQAAGVRPLFRIGVKGKQDEVELVELDWQAGGGERTLIVAAASAPGGQPATLRLLMQGRAAEMGPERRKVSIGRDPAADFVLLDRCASRGHAMIERRRDRFVLVDHSANGSYVSFDDRPETKVHHEELALVGHGLVSFGQPRAQAAQVLEFRASA